MPVPLLNGVVIISAFLDLEKNISFSDNLLGAYRARACQRILIGRELGGHTIRAVAEHFNRDPVAIT
jgi:hypothetical protein